MKTVYLFVLLLATILLLLFWTRRTAAPGVERKSESQSTARTDSTPAKSAGKLKHFTPQQFKDLAAGTKYPNTQMFEDLPDITGNQMADDYIRGLAESRGYRTTGIPVTPITKINEPRLENDDLLQPLAAAAWARLKAAAKMDGVPVSITSAYRSPEYQRNLFLRRLYGTGVTISQITSGKADDAIISVLSRAAIPGYSRHHTGYAIDLWCEDGSAAFLASGCFKWLSKDNYKVAKQNGWIPSYPDGVNLQGPEPEPWEYVWVSDGMVTGGV